MYHNPFYGGWRRSGPRGDVVRYAMFWPHALLRLALAGMLTLLLLPGEAAGDPVARARGHYERGAERYKAGRYAAAHEEFQRAYQITPLPDLLYNMAKADEQLGHLREAIEHLEAYLRDPASRDRETISALLQQLRARVGPGQAAEPAQRVEPAPAQKADPGAGSAPLAAAVVTRPAGPPGPGLRVAKWATASAGVAGVVIGAALLGVDGRQDCGAAPRQCMYVLDTAGAGIAVLTTGLVSLGTAGVLFWLDHRKNRRVAQALPGGSGRGDL